MLILIFHKFIQSTKVVVVKSNSPNPHRRKIITTTTIILTKHNSQASAVTSPKNINGHEFKSRLRQKPKD